MKTVALLALTLPFGPPPATGGPPPADWREVSVAGLTLLVGPGKPGLGLGGLTSTMPVKAAGGEGEIVARQGLSRDISVTIREADAAQVAAMFDLPAFLKGKVKGRIGEVRVVVSGDTFTLKATGFRIPGNFIQKVEASGDMKSGFMKAKIYAFNGLAEFDGPIPGKR